jgi:dynein heavy chain
MSSTILVSYRSKFDILFRALLERELSLDVKELFTLPEIITNPLKPYVTSIPSDGLVHDYKFIKEGKGKWILWSDDLVHDPPIPRDIPINQIIVSTIETIRYFYLFELLVCHQKPVLLVGPTGTGKSTYIKEFLLKKINPEIYKVLFITFSAQTTANQTQDIIMNKMDKIKKGAYGAPPGRNYLKLLYK